MKKIKFLLFVLFLAFAGAVVYQNWSYFSTKHFLSLDLRFKAYKTPEIANGLLLFGFFMVGFLAAYTSGLLTKFKTSKMVKELNATIDSQQEKISGFKSEIKTLKRGGDEPLNEPETPKDLAGEEAAKSETSTE